MGYVYIVIGSDMLDFGWSDHVEAVFDNVKEAHKYAKELDILEKYDVVVVEKYLVKHEFDFAIF